ncbi:HAD family hydrolase [Pullulanibacillus sp. KACC 23026]|uniref:HAD family hydrolase n=1 Tax=Pullulanibacillus sp. KACC 23026 TaxID=3028315 RepID=UPI0023B0662E|nr:HAD family hydrolase [Pullulanibacillus sp. KACC 23026]WEG13356.1 HAD family hydrolase [Pullulanibacillus sp. KACC 23026]
MVDSIIFDLDGTLWDTTNEAAKIWSEVAYKYNVNRPVSADQLKKLFGLPTEIIARKLFPNIPKEVAMEIMNESCEKQCPYIEEQGGILFPELIRTLNVLKNKFRLFIVSNCQEGYIQTFIRAHHLEGVFEDYEYPGRTGLSKSENIRLVIERNNLEEPVYVGDTLGDEKASREVGIPFIYARYGFGESDHHDYSIETLIELTKISFEFN